MNNKEKVEMIEVDKELYEELSDAARDFYEDNMRLNKEIEYLKDFITWMKLDDSYMDFRQNAKRTYKDEDDPFGCYTL